MMISSDADIQQLVRLKKTDAARVAVAELESAGLSVRTINLLEDCLDIIWLDELLRYTPAELQASVRNVGDQTIAEILAAVRRFDEARTTA